VTAGVTSVVPLAAAVPMPLLMITVSALLALQINVVDSPWMIVVVLADMLTVGTAFTVTITLAVSVPLAFVAVIV